MIRVSLVLSFTASVMFSVTLTPPLALAETYVAGFAGYGLSAQLSSVKGSGDLAGLTGSNLGLQNSPIYGVKVGHFQDNLKYFGGEAELYTATPYLKQQQFTLSGPSGAQTDTISGIHYRVTTAAFNVVYRYPGELIQPYAGVGLGVFWFTTPTSTTGSEIRPGLNVQAGIRVWLTEQLALFGEYKYNYANASTDDLKSHYNAHYIVAGVGWHF